MQEELDGMEALFQPPPPASLHEAARRGDVPVLQQFLESDPTLLRDPARLAAEDEKNGGPPLYLAAVAGHVEAVRWLIQQRADVNTRTRKKGYTALTGACARGHVEVASLLLRAGADPSVRDCYEETALMDAAHAGRGDIIRLLLRDRRVRVNEANRWGHTALWWACYSHRVEAARVLLLEGGADPSLGDLEGVKPIDVAMKRGNWGCVDLLRWFEGEVERAYHLSKCWQLVDDTQVVALAPLRIKATTTEEARWASIEAAPTYVRARVQRGEALPGVEVVEVGRHGGEGGPRARRGCWIEQERNVRTAVLQETLSGMREDAFKVLLSMMRYK